MSWNFFIQMKKYFPSLAQFLLFGSPASLLFTRHGVVVLKCVFQQPLYKSQAIMKVALLHTVS
jgi:hypothetical protein